MTKEVFALDALTPEKVDEHMKDDTWNDVLEKLMDTLLEDSDKSSLEVSYALVSMFVQTSYLNMIYNELQGDSVKLYEMGAALRSELANSDIQSQATDQWDEIMNGLEEKAKAMQIAIDDIVGA